MSDRPLVSIVTGCIPSRLDLLVEAMRNLREQTYSNIEHCIVIEGEPDEAEHAAVMVRLEAVAMGRHISTRVVALGRHWSRFLAASMSTAPFLVAQLVARGPLQMWLADDERMTPDHIESLVDLLGATSSDFVYSKAQLWQKDDPTWRVVIGNDPPMLGTITNALYRAELLDYRMFTFGVGSATDWDQVQQWMAAGARWAMLDRVTLAHRMDKLGEGPDFRAERQPLCGHRERVTS